MRAPQLVLAPATVAIGNSTNVNTNAARPGDLVLSVFALGLGPNFPLPPWGTVEIDLTFFASVALGLADSTGWFTVPFAVPNDPAVIGTYAFQSLAGDGFRLFLSNAAVMTVTL